MNNLGRALPVAVPQQPYAPIVIFAGDENTQHVRIVQDYCRRRHEIFSTQYGWEPTRPDGIEQDGYDRFGHCDYVLLVDTKGKVGAGCRLIWSTPATPLPIQKFLDDPSGIPAGSVEISRMVATSETARHSHHFLGYLLGYLSEHGVSSFYVTIRKRLLNKYAHSGFDCYEQLSGRPLEKTNLDGSKELFFPIRVGLDGYNQAESLLSRLCR